MKRTAASSATDGTLNKLPRQTPVSCKNCRAKKLKCDRSATCFNCTSRGIQCSYADASAVKGSSNAVEPQDGPILQDSLGARLDRLEQLLLTMANRKPGQPPVPSILQQPAIPTNDSRRLSNSRNSPSSDDGPLRQSSDAQEIERSLEQAAHTILTSFVPFGAFSPSQDFLKVRVLSVETMAAEATVPSLGIEAFLPTYEEACVLLEDYITQVEHLHRVIHVPNSRFHLQSMYDALAAGSPVSPARVALFLGIFANSAARATVAVDSSRHFTLGKAKDFAVLWQRIALDILDKLVRIRSNIPILEQLQATLVLSHPTNLLEGLSVGFRHLMMSALTMAREMGIHNLDTPANVKARRHATPEELVELELRRRLWWHIVATDWLAASIASPHQYVYNIHPAHFQVNQPLNADDEQLPFLVTGPSINPSAALPSQMSYELARIELGIISREVVDALPHDNASVDRLTARLRHLVENVPLYFRLDDASMSLCRAVHLQRPYLQYQGLLLTAGVHYRIVELHRARLIQCRSSTESEARRRYATSRAICLDSSRAVIKCGQGPPEVWELGAFVHHYFMATLALAFDLHHNTKSALESLASPKQQQASRAEVQEACDLLLHVQRLSTTVQRLIKPLTDVLKRANDRALDNDGATTTSDGYNTSISNHTAKLERICRTTDLNTGTGTEYLDPFSDILDTVALDFDDESLNIFFRDLDSGFASF